MAILALSSGESELAAIVKASGGALGAQSSLKDFGLELSIRVRSDATAAIGIVSRQGLAKVRHLAVSDLWVQQKSRSGEVAYSKVDGKANFADCLTKALDGPALKQQMGWMNLIPRDGRSPLAPNRSSTCD